MMSVRFDPIGNFGPFREVSGSTEHPTRPQLPQTMPMNAYRRGDTIHVELEIPGVSADAIDLTVENNVLTIRADRNPTTREGDDLLVAERQHGSFRRQLALAESVDADRIDASYENGVLHLQLPLISEAQPRKVAVRPTETGQQPSAKRPPGPRF